MSHLLPHFRRLAGFAGLPALSLIAPIILLPLVSHRYGSNGWASIGFGQSLGAFASIAIGLSWPMTGAYTVATAPDLVTRRALYVRSVTTRAFVALISIPIAVAVAVAVVPTYKLETALFVVGIALNGMTASWYFAGVGTPSPVFWNEGVTRLAGYLTAVMGLLLGAGLAWYGLMTVLSGSVAVLLNWRSAIGSWRSAPVARGQFWRDLREQGRGTVSRLVQSAFNFGGTSIAAISGLASVTTYVGADQLQKASNNALGIVPQALIAWIGSDLSRLRGRQLKVLLGASVAAVAGFGAWALVGDAAVGVIFSGRLTLTFAQNLLLGAIIFVFFMNRLIEQLVIIPFGMLRVVWNAGLACSVLGAGGLVLAGRLNDMTAALSVGALVQTFQLCVYGALIWRPLLGGRMSQAFHQRVSRQSE